MLCILYVIAITTCLGLVAALAELALPAGWARRWIWVGTITLSVAIPGLYRVWHNVALHDPMVMRASTHTALVSPLIYVSMALSFGLVALQALRVWYLVRRERRTSAVVDGVTSLVTDSVGPATVGVFRSRVVIPRWVLALPAVQRRYVMQHEEEHRASRDTVLLAIGSIAAVIVPWNLPLWWQLRRLGLAVEMDCDTRVVRTLGDARRYGELLLRVAEAGGRTQGLQPALLGSGLLERRIGRLVAPRSRSLGVRVLASAAAMALLYLVLMLPHPVLGH